MIDKTYFETAFAKQRERMDGACTVRLHLHDGSVLELFRIEDVEPGYVLVQAYPLDGSKPKQSKSDEEGLGGLKNGPRLAIPYETIAYVELTREVPKGAPGFQPNVPGEK